MIKTIPAKVYIGVVQMPYQNHLLAKDILNKLKTQPKAKVRCKRKQFGKTKKRELRGLFNFTITQMNWYCPADVLTLQIKGETVIISYQPKRQHYKGVEEL